MHRSTTSSTTDHATARPAGTSPTVLLAGGTGMSGRRVAARLVERGRPHRVASRSTEPAFDWHVASSWPAVLDGVGAAYLSYSPDLAFPGAADAIGGFAEAAVAAGVERLVLLSGRGEEGTWPAEAAVRSVDADWTILRSAFFAQDFSEHFLLGLVLDGVIALPAGSVAEPFVDLADLADVAVAALTEDGHAGRTYELTGPRLLTFADVAADLTATTGRTVTYLPVSPDEYVEAAVAAGVPAEEVEPLTDVFTRIFDGRNAYVTPDVAAVLGRPARDFRDFAAAAAATGVWALGEDVAS